MAPAKVALALLFLCPLVAGRHEFPDEEEAVVLLQDKVTEESGTIESHAVGGRETKASAGSLASKSLTTGELSFRKVAAEFIAMTLFVFIGCGSAMSTAKAEGSAWEFQVSLTFGLAITTLAYTIGHYSGAQINCAVTLGLVIYGQVGVLQGFLNFLGQLLGAVFGAAILKAMYPETKDCTGGLGCNGISEDWTPMGALIGEFMGTFLLMYVVFESAVNSLASDNSSVAPLAIGFAVFLAHSVLIPVDGCSINPTRSFGPALVQSMTGAGSGPWKDMWVFWVGPLLGAAAAAGVYALMSS